MPEEKEYGYARDLADIDDIAPDSSAVPAEVTENYITFEKDNHFTIYDDQSGATPIYNHDMTIGAYVSSEEDIKANYEEFDVAARQAVAEAMNPPETDEEEPNLEPNLNNNL